MTTAIKSISRIFRSKWSPLYGVGRTADSLSSLRDTVIDGRDQVKALVQQVADARDRLAALPPAPPRDFRAEFRAYAARRGWTAADARRREIASSVIQALAWAFTAGLSFAAAFFAAQATFAGILLALVLLPAIGVGLFGVGREAWIRRAIQGREMLPATAFLSEPDAVLMLVNPFRRAIATR